MTAREMQVEFERRITLMNPAFELKEKLTSDTIFSFLNAYTERFVRNNYLLEDSVADGSRAQKKNADALKGLIVRLTLTPYKGENIVPDGSEGTVHDPKQLNAEQTQTTDCTDCNSNKFKLPEDYFLYIRSNSKVSSTYKGKVSTENGNFLEILTNKTISEDDTEKVLSTAFNKAIIRNPYIILNAGKADDASENCYLNVIHDTYTTIVNVDLVYYRKPKKFDVIGVDKTNVLDHCELPENVHMEIVEGAVEMFITEAKYRLNMKQPEQQ